MSAQRLALLVLAVLSAALAGWSLELLARLGLGAEGLRVHAAVSLLVALGTALLLGLPCILLLERIRPLSRGGVLMLAVLIALLPAAVWNFPGRTASGHLTTVLREGTRLVPLLVDGVPTRTAWLRYLQQLAGLALLGLIAGEVFWRVRRTGMRAMAEVAARNRNP